MARKSKAVVLATYNGTTDGEQHHVLQAQDGGVYCDCPGWKFSKASPKTCKHVERYCHGRDATPARGIPLESALYAVICRDDATDDMQSKGPYALATRQLFATEREAEDYADGLSFSRDPVIVVGNWANVAALGARYGSRVYVKVIRNLSPGMHIPGFGALRVLGVAPDPADLSVPIADYSALRLPGAAVSRVPLGARDCNGATLYQGDWIRDTVTGFVMCAAAFKADDPPRFVTLDEGHCIVEKHADLYTPTPKTPVGRIAFCDQAAHALAVAALHAPPVAQGPSVFDNLDEWI